MVRIEKSRPWSGSDLHHNSGDRRRGDAVKDEAAGPQPQKSRLVLLATGHAVTDSFGQSLIAPLLPALREQLGVGLAPLMGLMAIMGLSGSLSQPLFGWLSDKFPRLCLVAVGPVLAAAFIGLIGYATGYMQLALLLFLAGLGISAFHPQGAALARQASAGRAGAMSAFTVGGNIGFGLAPLLGLLYARWFGLPHFYLAAIPAVIFGLVMARSFYRQGGICPREAARAAAPAGERNLPALAALTATVMIRSAVQIGLMQLLPFVVALSRPGEDGDWLRGGSVSALLLAGAASGIIGGRLSDRFGRRRLMGWSLALAPWPLLWALHRSGWEMAVGLSIGSFLLMLSHPSNVIMSQEYLPGREGTAASMITGLAWGLAHLAMPLLGLAAEHVGALSALQWLVLLPLAGLGLIACIPADRDMAVRPVLLAARGIDTIEPAPAGLPGIRSDYAGGG